MMDVIDLFREKSTVDELGLGTIRDALADRLFPGTSTIMTRARYYLLVPWTYLALEARQVPAVEFARRARRAEDALIDAIEMSEDKAGNIGRIARSKLKRPPSNVYWAGLRTWGIRLRQLSQSDYHRSVGASHQVRGQRLGRREARDVEHDDVERGMWDGGIAPCPPGFPGKCSLQLRFADANYLSHRIRTATRTRDSLLAELVQQGTEWSDADHIWFHPEAKKWPANLRELVEHARMFSEVMLGASLLYNHALLRLMGKESPFEQSLDDWATTMQQRAQAYEQWDTKRFWELVRAENPRLGVRAMGFAQSWWELVASVGASRIKDSNHAYRLIEEREVQLKGKLARLAHAPARERWNESSGTDQMDYRWGRTRVIMQDIFDGLNRRDEEGNDAAA